MFHTVWNDRETKQFKVRKEGVKMFLKKVLLQLSDVSMRKYQEHLFSMRPQIQTNMEVILTGGQPSLSGELSGDGGSTMMLATLQE